MIQGHASLPKFVTYTWVSVTHVYLINRVFDITYTWVEYNQKTIFWFRLDTKREPQIGRYRNRYQNHISKEESSYQKFSFSMGYFFYHKRAPKTKFVGKF